MNILSKIKYLVDKPQISYGTYFKKRDTDFEIVSAIKDKIAIAPENIPEARNKFTGIQYHQPYVHENSCSAHGPATILSALTGITFTTADIKRIWDQEVAKGNAHPDWGGYSWKMVDAWRNWWNEIHKGQDDKQICSITVEMGSDLFFKLQKKGYGITSGYRWVEGYDEDWYYDGIVNRQWDTDVDLESYGTFKDGGHCLAWFYTEIFKRGGSNYINVDNYKDSPNRIRNNNNIYGIDEKIIKELCKKGIWHEWGYTYMFKSDVEKANLVLDKKLIARLENRVIYNKETDKFAIIKNGKAELLKGKNMSELFAKKWANTNESYVLGIDANNWKKIGL